MATTIPVQGYKEIFYNSPAAKLIIDIDSPHFTILDVNNAYLLTTNSLREDLVGKPVFAPFPANPTDNDSKNIERTIFSFDEAIRTKKPHVMSNYRYDIPIPGTNDFEERYWTTSNTPILNDEGEVIYFIHSPLNVTEIYKLTQREKLGVEALKNQRKQLYSIFMQAPVGIGIFKGPDYVVDLINPPLCELYGKSVNDLMGKPIFEALPSAKGIGFEEILDNVRLTGVPFKGQGLNVPLVRNNILESVYVNFVYEPYRDDEGIIIGVIAIATDVTEQINARHQLEDAEERARLAVDAVGLGTFDLDVRSNEMFTSPRFNAIFGFNKPVRRSELVAVIHPDDQATRLAANRKALESGTIFYEVRVIWPDKSVHWVRIEGKVYYDGDAKPLRILGTLLDITEQRKNREEQRKLITLADNSVDLMSILDMDGKNSYINDAGKNMLGFDNDEEVKTIPISELHTPQDFDFVNTEVLPTVMSKGRWAGTMFVRHLKTREVFPVFNNCIRIDDPVSGNPIAVGAVMRDLRPEIAAKQKLADSEQLLRSITTAAPTGLWMSDEHGAITYVNQTWIDWTGLSFEENLGYGWVKSIVLEDRQRAGDKFQSDLAARVFYEVEFRINHVDGSVKWCIATGSPQYRSDGTFSGYIGSCSDITEQKSLQQQKDDFIGIASHELKTPVTSIKAYTQVLEKVLYNKGDVKEAAMIAKMDTQINRLTSLIGDLLDVTKINSGKLQFNNSEFDFDLLVTDLVEDLQRTTDKHTLIENLGHTGIIVTDKERIGQVITNLITNAIKYSPKADKVIIKTEVTPKEVILSVQDFGIGISNELQSRVFEQFYRVGGDMQHTFPGLGLGLYISAEIIRREGGRIWVESKEGEGSIFSFALPNKRDNVS